MSERLKNPTSGTERMISRENVRALDEDAVDEYGIPGIVLMENAASAIMAAVCEMIEGSADPFVLIYCGTGNNGGDGFALARKLHNAEIPCSCALVGDVSQVRNDALTNYRIIEMMGIPIFNANTANPSQTPTLVIDAIIGTGLSREIEGRPVTPIERIKEFRASGAKVLAVDVPSGIDCDTGEPIGEHIVSADMTVTFVLSKSGFANPASRAYTGDVRVADIGVPRVLINRYAE